MNKVGAEKYVPSILPHISWGYLCLFGTLNSFEYTNRYTKITLVSLILGCQSMSSFLKRALRLEGPQLTQRTTAIKKNVRESLGMRIGGGIGSNEGDTPIYVANIHPHGCIGKSKQLKVGTFFFIF